LLDLLNKIVHSAYVEVKIIASRVMLDYFL